MTLPGPLGGAGAFHRADIRCRHISNQNLFFL